MLKICEFFIHQLFHSKKVFADRHFIFRLTTLGAQIHYISTLMYCLAMDEEFHTNIIDNFKVTWWISFYPLYYGVSSLHADCVLYISSPY